jgi:fatty-acid desaturase
MKLFAASNLRNRLGITFASLMAIYGLFTVEFSWQWALAGWLAFQFYWVVGLSMGWHRYFCHGAFKTSRFWEEVMIFAGCASMVGHPGAFSVVHLVHHRYSDTDEDPHLLYRDELFPATKIAGVKLNTAMKKKFFLSPQMKRIHRFYMLYPILAAGLLGAFSFEAMFYLWAMPVFVMQFIRRWILVIIAHREGLGYANFDTGDNSRNFWLISVLFGGEGLHNNHHEKPGAWNFAMKWWEVDPTSWLIRLIRS